MNGANILSGLMLKMSRKEKPDRAVGLTYG